MAGFGPEDLHALAQDLLAAAADSLDTIPTFAPALAGAPGRTFVSPGLPALDCCDQLTVHTGLISEDIRSPSGPQSGQRARYAARKNVVTLSLTITRCIPVVEGNEWPNPTEMEDAAAQINADGWALWNLLWNLVRSDELFTLCGDSRPELRPLAPSGGCAGWMMVYRVELEGYEEPAQS